MTTEAADAAAPEPVPIPEPVPVPENAPVRENAAGPELGTGPEPGAVSAPGRRPRGRTALIMAVAVVLGVLGGAGAGYAAQAARKPTPLPSLAVAQPRYPAHRVAAPALPASQDDQVKTDGAPPDLLVQPPKGAKYPLVDWMTLADYAETRAAPAGAFSSFADMHFRRAAESIWFQGGNSYEIRLVQFAHDAESSASTDVSNQQGYMDVPGVLIPGESSGLAYPGSKKDPRGAYAYNGYAFAQHGDISLQIRIESDQPVSAGTLVTLATSQLERL